jgi:L-lactate permease
MYWLGAYADGGMGPLTLKADFVLDTGKVQTYGATTAEDVKYNGWLGRLGLTFPWEAFEIGLLGVYATGSDAAKTSYSGLPGTTTADAAADDNSDVTLVGGTYL